MNAEVGKYCGEMGVDYWKEEKWREEIGKHNVIVCTAKIMQNLLHLGYIKMAKVRMKKIFIKPACSISRDNKLFYIILFLFCF